MSRGVEGGSKMARGRCDVPHCALYQPFQIALSRYSIDKYAKDIVLAPLALRHVVERGKGVESKIFIPYRSIIGTGRRHEGVFGFGWCALNRTPGGKLASDVNCAKYVIFRGQWLFL